MVGIVGIAALLTVLTLSLFITRIATIALAATGLSREAARFQARSAFTGTGFTTTEAEKVVDHPARRQIINLLMLLRSAGLISILISLILTFGTTASEPGILFRIGWLALGCVILLLLARSKYVDRLASEAISKYLSRWTDLDVRDYASLLKLSGEYGVKELQIQDEDWLEGKYLSDCQLDEEGVKVLGINRPDGRYVGAPKGNTKIQAEDVLILYGKSGRIEALDRRRADAAGEQDHEEAVKKQKKDEAEQDREEREESGGG